MLLADVFCEHEDMGLNLIDLKRYPIEFLDYGEGAQFLEQCQQQIIDKGWCSFEEFLHPDAVTALTNEAKNLLPTADILTIKRTIYNTEPDLSAKANDPKGKQLVHKTVQLANDQIPPSTIVQRLYQSKILTEFVRRVQKKEHLYHCADEFQALNIIALQPDNWHAWHYDTLECTVTLLLQAAQKGGEFAFLPNSRTDETEDRESVEQVIAGDLSKTKSFSRGAGTFTLFRGGYSLHGVTKVEGSIPRVTAIFTYDEQPGRVLSNEVNIQIYGPRVEKILSQRNLAKQS